MIAREWRGRVRAERGEEYVAYMWATGVGEYVRTDGNRHAWVLSRDLGDGRAEVVAFSLWDSMDDVRRFAGDDENEMVLYPEDRDFLLDEPTLRHYEVHGGPAVDATL